MSNPVVHFEIVTKDAPASREFYRNAFGWTIESPYQGANIADYTSISTNDSRGIAGGIGTPPEGYDGHVTFYVGVTDVTAKLRELEGLGAQTMMPATELPGLGFSIALFKDPQGHTVGLVSIPAEGEEK